MLLFLFLHSYRTNTFVYRCSLIHVRYFYEKIAGLNICMWNLQFPAPPTPQFLIITYLLFVPINLVKELKLTNVYG